MKRPVVTIVNDRNYFSSIVPAIRKIDVII